MKGRWTAVTVLSVVALVALLVASTVPVPADGAWQIETVDSEGVPGGWRTSLALDASDRPHFSYYGYSPGHEDDADLKYAFLNGSEWQIETVDSEGDVVGQFSSLALDVSGKPHISYYFGNDGDLRYASWNGSAWQVETVDSAGVVGEYTSLALDASDRPRISYYDNTNKSLKYASWNGSAWQVETVDNSGVGCFSSLALDASDRPRISYWDYVNDNIKLASWDGSAWQIETIDSAGRIAGGGYTSLALDTSDRPRVSYFDKTNTNLKLASWNGSAWQIGTVDNAGGLGSPSLALDASDRPRISYFDRWNAKFKLASWNGWVWQIETVDSGEGTHDVFYDMSLALDSLDRPRISYFDYTNYDIKYAGRDNPAPAITGISHTSAFQGQDLNLSIVSENTHFANGTSTATFSGAGITVNSTTVLDATHATANITISAGAPTGARDVNVITAGETPAPLTGCFTVNQSPGLAVTSVAPSFGVEGSSVPISNLAGTGFQAGATVRIEKPGTTVNATGVVVVSSTRIICRLSLSEVPLGRYDVVVKNTDDQEARLVQGFSVTNICGGGAAVSLSLFGIMMGLMSLAGSAGLRRRIRRRKR